MGGDEEAGSDAERGKRVQRARRTWSPRVNPSPQERPRAVFLPRPRDVRPPDPTEPGSVWSGTGKECRRPAAEGAGPWAGLGRRTGRADIPRRRHAAGLKRHRRAHRQQRGSLGSLQGRCSPSGAGEPESQDPGARPQPGLLLQNDPSPARSGGSQKPAAAPHHQRMPAQRQPRRTRHVPAQRASTHVRRQAPLPAGARE